MNRLNFQFTKPVYDKGGVVIYDNNLPKFKVSDFNTGHCISNHLKCLLHRDIVERNGGWEYLANMHTPRTQQDGLTQATTQMDRMTKV